MLVCLKDFKSHSVHIRRPVKDSNWNQRNKWIVLTDFKLLQYINDLCFSTWNRLPRGVRNANSRTVNVEFVQFVSQKTSST